MADEMMRELTTDGLSAADYLCSARQVTSGHSHGYSVGGCPACRAYIIAGVDAPEAGTTGTQVCGRPQFAIDLCAALIAEICERGNHAFIPATILLNLAALTDAYEAALRSLPAPAAPEAWRDVLAERERQKAVLGWTEEHDDQHENGELAEAAAAFACAAAHLPGPSMWKSNRLDRTPREKLVRAGALILAEIERLDRLDHTGGSDGH